MQDGVTALLAGAGIELRTGARNYRPAISLPDCEVKVLKPQDVIEMLAIGSRDFGFAGADWVEELGVELVELLDTGLNPVRLVAAAPAELLVDGELPDNPLVVASEYEAITKRWLDDRGKPYTFVHASGATEVFPPEDADCIVDNTATGSTLAANDLVIVAELMTSSTRLYANPRTLENAAKRERIEAFAMLVQSVLEARRRVMLEVNVAAEQLEHLIAVLPCMREPTIARLHHEAGFAVKAAVPRAALPTLIPELKARGGTDVVVSSLNQIVP